MNSKKFTEAMSELDDKYVDETLSYEKSHISKTRPKRIGVLIAAVITVLALCGFVAYELGLFDPWFQKPSTDQFRLFKVRLKVKPIKSIQFACVYMKLK